MPEIVRYGQTDAEKVAEENQSCRQIVHEINNFGINERQRLFIIYLLSMELENVEHMQVLSSVVRELGGREIFLIDREEKDGTIGT